MDLKSIDTPALIEVAAGWLSEKHNSQWLDFGSDVSAACLQFMVQKDTNMIRAFTSDDDVAIGVVGLSQVDRTFKTATFWAVLGDKRYSRNGYTLRASSKILTIGFTELDLHAVNTWLVECNHPSQQLVKRLNFRPIGRQRQCHYVDGRLYDRLWFDILACEHGGLENA